MEGRECRAGNIGKEDGFGWWYSKKRKTNGCGTGSCRLAPELREVILLIYFGDCKLKEVADILQIGLPLVKYRHKRAKEELIKLLGEEDSDEFEKDDAKL